MARPPHMYREHRRVRARADAAIYHYCSYAYVEEDTFGHFLTEFHRVWQLAHEQGLSHVDGVRRLAEISPLEWRGYVTEIRGDFIYRQEGLFDLEADLPRFIGRLSQVFGQYGRAPFGPYLPPREYTVRPTEDWLYQTMARDDVYPSPLLQPPGWKFDFQAGPSRPMCTDVPQPSPVLVRPIAARRMRTAEHQLIDEMVRHVHGMMEAGIDVPSRNEHDDEQNDGDDKEEDPDEDPEDDSDGVGSSPSVNAP